MDPVQLLVVGGFLGAGKTTLLAQAARRLVALGKRVGLVTNDQADNLVDTAVLRAATGAGVREVSGGCFCCNFNELLSATDELIRTYQPDMIISEPVGSCTDLSATVLQPLKKHHGRQFRVAPFSVLVDVRQMRTLDQLWQVYQDDATRRFPDEVLYIYRKQLEEADLIVLNKVDLVPEDQAALLERVLAEHFPAAGRMAISAKTGRGVDRWLQYVIQDGSGGGHLAEMDYDTYARGEAALAWLNASVRLKSPTPQVWDVFCRGLLAAIRDQCRESNAAVAHIKIHLSCPAGTVTANLTDQDDVPAARGQADVRSETAELLINARVVTDPQQLRGIVQRCLEQVAGATMAVEMESVASFAPPRPVPAHRFDSVVDQ